MNSDCVLFCLLVFVKNFLREMNNWVHRKRKSGVTNSPDHSGCKEAQILKNLVLSSSEKRKGSFLFYSFC